MTGADATDLDRRSFLLAAAGASAATAAATPAAAQSGIDYGGWFSDVPNFDGTTADMTGQSEVTVDVGVDNGNGQAFAFGPPAVQVDPGTTVVWEWTGEGGSHNVLHEGGDLFGSELLAEAGATYEFTFEEAGIYKYYCQPHRGLGMKAAVVVGQPQQNGGGDGDEEGGGEGHSAGPLVPDAARSITVASLVAMLATLGLAFFFIKYGEASEPEA